MYKFGWLKLERKFRGGVDVNNILNSFGAQNHYT